MHAGRRLTYLANAVYNVSYYVSTVLLLAAYIMVGRTSSGRLHLIDAGRGQRVDPAVKVEHMLKYYTSKQPRNMLCIAWCPFVLVFGHRLIMSIAAAGCKATEGALLGLLIGLVLVKHYNCCLYCILCVRGGKSDHSVGSLCSWVLLITWICADLLELWCSAGLSVGLSYIFA
jgi:hypothetical protein